MRKLISEVFASEKKEYYLESREWIVTRTQKELFIKEYSSKILAADREHQRVLNPLTLLKVKKAFYELEKTNQEEE